MPVMVAHSETAEGRVALRWAVTQARWHSTDLVVVRVLDEGEPWPAAAAQRSAEVEVGATVAELDDVAWRLLWAVADPDRAATLVDCAIRQGAELLVISARRRSPLGKFLLGSTVQRVVLDAPMPVIVVKTSSS